MGAALPLSLPYPVAVLDRSAPVPRWGLIIPTLSTGLPNRILISEHSWRLIKSAEHSNA
jgi:hypothetical protein